MGEHAVDQMMLDYKRATGTEADGDHFEEAPRARRTKPTCGLRKKRFGSGRAVRDHIRDAHKKKELSP